MVEDSVLDPREVQASHRRLLQAAKDGEEPDAADVEMAQRVKSSPFSGFDRPWRSDD